MAGKRRLSYNSTLTPNVTGAAMIDWREIDTVLLDMDGTLLDLHFDSHFWLEHLPRRYRELHQLDEASQEALRARILGEQGTLNWYSLAYWSRELGVDIVALKREVQHLIGLRSDALDFLKWLKQAHPRVVLATNADRASLALKLPLTGLEGYLDAIVSSEDVGAAKESRRSGLPCRRSKPLTLRERCLSMTTPACSRALANLVSSICWVSNSPTASGRRKSCRNL
ncbi:hypothetical protein HORIV_21900 [Vreelandella olivaria]|uniref:Uncharacterized protein n=1 Tax=Vreelandella olivaria TaxID=390919 RepID=A0ABN5WS48_9GAMM|nr:hypothetical protein HORIV_21900 [Halomonas olivaria]